MLVKSWDIQANYNFDLDAIGFGSWGDFRASLNATYADTYTWQEAPDKPVREAKVIRTTPLVPCRSFQSGVPMQVWVGA